MIRTKEIIGIPVLEKGSNKRLCNISDIIYSKQKSQIIAFLISRKKFFTKAKYLMFKDVNVITERFIIIDDSKIIKKSSVNYDNLNYYNNDFIIGTEVLTECHENLGFIKDIIFNNKNGNIVGFILTDGIIQDLIYGRNIIPINEEFKFLDRRLIVPRNLKKEIEKNKEIYKKVLG